MRFDDDFKARIARHLAAFDVHSHAGPGGHAAAVAVAITEEGHGADLSGMDRHPEWSRDAALILTRRAGHLRRHAGQWALPGGRIDEGESPEQAVLREMQEEIGLALGPDAFLGRLDDFVTRSGFVITPLVLWAGPARGMHPNADEVESIHRIPVQEFMRSDAPLLDVSEHSEHPVLRMPVGDAWIAAPTAAILYQFRELCVAGRPTRVAHFDQPAFAWK